MDKINKLPITIVIRTLNEKDKIVECINSCIANNVLEVIVVDGGSIDETLELISKFNIKIIKCEKGLVVQRDNGINASSIMSKYIAIVDADDILDKNCMYNLILDLQKANAHAVQAKHESYSIYSKKRMSYWEKAMLVNLKIINSTNEDNTNNISMVGRPALYEKKMLVKTIGNNKSKFTTASEDADLSYNLKQQGALFTFGTGITYRKNLETFFELSKRWMSYGSGDAKFMLAHKNRIPNVIFHLLINYPIIRAYKASKSYSIKYIPFFILQGLIRFVSAIKYLIFGIGKMDNYRDI